MKYLQIYREMGLKTNEDVFNYFIGDLKRTNRTFDFFVDWAKVFQNIDNIEIELNLLNYLIGKDDINDAMKYLIGKHPEIVSIIPILIAIREKNIEILFDFKNEEWVYKNYSFDRKDEYSDDKIVEFCDNIGILDLIKNKKIKNFVDYCIGLEVGIGTNGRKNRSGKISENIFEYYIDKLTKEIGAEYIRQATRSKIKEKWNEEVPFIKNNRKYDFAIMYNNKISIIEVNYFGGGGTKLKSVSSEFRELNNYLKKNAPHCNFIWITDGLGWNTTKNSLREAFDNNEYVINVKMIFDGVLESILKDGE